MSSTVNITIGSRVRLAPVHVLPGRNVAAEINAAIVTLGMSATATQKKTLWLTRGRYELEAPIVGASNVILRGEGADTILVPTFTGGADDLTNAVIKADGAIDAATLNASLSADVSKNADAIAVTAAGAIAAGDYILIAGNNGGGQNYVGDFGMSDGAPYVVLEEVQRVGASYAGGLTLPLAWPLQQSHAGPVKATVRAVTPVVGFEVHDLQILGSQSSVITAVGVLVRHSVNTEIHGVTASGCSRAAINAQGAKGFRSSGFRSLGTNNAWYFLQTVIDGDIWGFSGADDVPRNHASGIPRWQIYAWCRCTAVHIHDGVLSSGNGGLFHGGGLGMVFSNIKTRNQRLDLVVYNRRVASGEWQNGGGQPLGFGVGHSPLDRAEFARGCTYDNLSVEDLWAEDVAPLNAGPFITSAFYIHDTFDFVATNLIAMNLGIGATRVCGVIMSDCGGVLGTLTIKGFDWGLRTQNVVNNVEIGGLILNAVRANSPNAIIPIFLDHTSNPGRGPRIKSLQVGNFFSFLRFGGSFLFDPDFMIRNLITDQGQWEYTILANNQTGVAFSTGDVVEIDPTHTGTDLRIRTPDTGAAGYETRLAVVASGATEDVGTGFLLIAPLPQLRASVKATTAAVAYGDRIGYAATRRAVADAAGTLGVARTRKASGAEGMITVGAL